MRRKRCHRATERTERRSGEWRVVSGEQTRAAMSFQVKRGICFSFRSQRAEGSSSQNRPRNDKSAASPLNDGLASRPMPPYFWPRLGMHFLISIVGTWSWFGVRTSVVGAARFFDGREFHQLDAGVVRIVKIKLPLAVAANFRFFAELHAIG